MCVPKTVRNNLPIGVLWTALAPAYRQAGVGPPLEVMFLTGRV